eukprot:TRINITY_DN38650_c0_g2_i1.p1 TRINITY_DN38650_c0_g2~~TRINITY_DN38650_c0_g2_i1.p1  ORF type:complete len:112 (+),score=0.77 TRINITY_DN38650_c0_g2_i1:147-482(+)
MKPINCTDGHIKAATSCWKPVLHTLYTHTMKSTYSKATQIFRMPSSDFQAVLRRGQTTCVLAAQANVGLTPAAEHATKMASTERAKQLQHSRSCAATTKPRLCCYACISTL